jgi:hypothetical protein
MQSEAVCELTILNDEERGSIIEEILEQLRIKGRKLPTQGSFWLKESYTHELKLCEILLQYEHDEAGGGSPKTTVYITEKFGRPQHAKFFKGEVTGYTATYTGSKERGFESIGLNSLTITPQDVENSSFAIPIDDAEKENFDALLQYVKRELSK